MLKHFNNTNNILIHAMRLARRRPAVLLPLACLWAAYVPLVAYLTFQADIKDTNPFFALLLLSMVPIGLHFGMALTSAMLAQITADMEAGRKTGMVVVCRDVYHRHKFRFATLGVVAGALSMFVIMFQAAQTGYSSGIPEALRAPSFENLARILLGIGSDDILAIESLKYAMIKKALRLTIFLIVPALMISRREVGRMLDPAFHVIDRNVAEAVGGLLMTSLIIFILTLPAANIVRWHDEGFYELGNAGWALLCGYAGFLWVTMLFLEQAFCLTLFRWQDARDARGPKATLNDAPMPNIGGI